MTDMLRRAGLTAVAGLGLCLTLLPAGQAQAHVRAQAPVRVPCNDIAALKRAIDDANTGGGSIVLAPHCIYSLTQADNADDGLPEITGKVRISGDRTTVQRPHGPAFRIFHVKNSGSLTLDSLTVRGGQASTSVIEESNGGALYNEGGRATLTGVTVRNNSSLWLGGGIWNSRGTLVLKGTTVRDNNSFVAGGLATNGTMTMQGGAIRDNTGSSWAGGLANGGDTKLDHVSLDGNHVGDQGGGLGGGIMTMLIDNETGPLRLNSTKVRDNISQTRGGGVFIGQHEPTTLYRSVVTRNAANGGAGSGGGIHNDGRRFGIYTRPIPGPQRTIERASTKQQLPEVNLIRSAVFKNTPDNCAPPNSVPRCDAVGSAPAAKAPKPSGS
ncbi:hypothetical protein [Streptomyces winkii]|uniref:hypothetical protein n=1 Tax=Streptomyces winkii TaxID=3051178 RepID=UPI0028D667C6|nr:hypothetical protein [Streptomyces sp. DSM 40971]